jgi:hypothetical protein
MGGGDSAEEDDGDVGVVGGDVDVPVRQSGQGDGEGQQRREHGDRRPTRVAATILAPTTRLRSGVIRNVEVIVPLPK